MEPPLYRPTAIVPPIQTDFVLQHPTPGSDSLHALHLSNVERLEQTAERISVSSADLGEEILKIWQEQKRRDSRASTSPSRSSRPPPIVDASRHKSTSSHARSIVGINNEPRYGGYSPGGYITSPISPVSNLPSSSDPWSCASKNTAEVTSELTTSGCFPLPESGKRRLVSPRSATLSAKFTPVDDAESLAVQQSLARNGQTRTSEVPLDTQAARRNHDGKIAGNRLPLTTPHSTTAIVATSLDDTSGMYEVPRAETVRNGEKATNSPILSTISIGESKTLQAVVGNDHGVNMSFDSPSDAAAIRPADPEGRNAKPTARNSQNLRWSDNLPSEDMVYYPAPVPRTLILPQRLSQQRPVSTKSPRISQFYGSLPVDARKSGIWDSRPQNESVEHGKPESPPFLSKDRAKQRQGYLSMQGLPPPLRASIYFDQPSATHEIEIKNGSAVATLDSFLDASAHAPVATLAARVASLGNVQISPNHTTTLNVLPDPLVNSRNSRVPPPTPSKRNSAEVLDNMDSSKPGHASNEKATVAIDNECENHHTQTYGEGDETRDCVGSIWDVQARSPNDHENDEQRTRIDSVPTTLLAELQLRKEHQRLRTRTAANALPTGMHATLLELDSVYQTERKLRQAHRTSLAWERHAGEIDADEDENVPLALLPTAQNEYRAVKEQSRPMALMEKHEMEQTEPLRQRRQRLQGQVSNGPPAVAGHPEDRAENLAQRTRELKEMQSCNDRQTQAQFQHAVPPTSRPQPQDETLAQRRQRLRTSQLPPELHHHHQHQPQHPQPHQPPQSFNHQLPHPPHAFPPIPTLLSQTPRYQQPHRHHLHSQNTNMHYPSMPIPMPIPMPTMPDFRNMTGQEVHAVRPLRGGFMGGMYNDGAGGMGWR